MASATMQSLSDLYTEDETAWLEAMAALARQGDDVGNLGEYLTDMAQ